MNTQVGVNALQQGHSERAGRAEPCATRDVGNTNQLHSVQLETVENGSKNPVLDQAVVIHILRLSVLKLNAPFVESWMNVDVNVFVNGGVKYCASPLPVVHRKVRPSASEANP